MKLNEFENSLGGPLGPRASFTLGLERQMVDNGSVINAVTLNSQTFNLNPFTAVPTTPQRRFWIGPRIEFQLDDHNTLSVRYSFVHTDVQDAGIGGFDLVSRGDHRRNTYNTVQLIETTVHGIFINETRFQYYRWANDVTANSPSSAILVLGAFNGGGGQMGHSSDLQNNYEFQNYTTVAKGRHILRFGLRLRAQTDANVSPQNFGGTFTFSGVLAPQLDEYNQPIPGALVQIPAIEQYRRTLVFQQAGYSVVQMRPLGGGPSQFSLSAGMPGISGRQIDAGPFLGDEWRLSHNLTVNLGFRYETQTNISDHTDFAPRVGLAWAPRPGSAKQPKTVIRAGFGIFYDRFPLSNTLAAERYNGTTQQQYVITNPDFYPIVPSASSLSGSEAAQVIREVDSHLRATSLMQSALALERQLPRNTTLAITYTNSHAVHVLRSEDINAPLPGLYDPQQTGNSVFSAGTPNPLFLMTSSAVYNQNQWIVNLNTKINRQVSLSSSYTWNDARSNSDGLGTFPANPYNFAGEYGPGATDIRQRLQFTGALNTRWNIRLSPNVILQSGPPFDVTTGTDPFGTTLFNARPGIAIDPTKPGVIQTAYGLLDPNPVAGERLLSRNFGRGPGQVSVNLRLGKTFTFGPEPVAAAPSKSHGVFSAAPDRRYNLSISMSARNLLNHTNPGPIIGNITSPLFGKANQIFGGPNGEGFSENANNRRLELQTRFMF